MSIDDYPRWEERLDTMHSLYGKEGFKIFVNHLQLPTAENGEQAIMTARVECPIGIFTDYGDADPSNVGKNIRPHIIRMASTRAKARAVGMAINEGKPAAEELGGGESAPAPVHDIREATDPDAITPETRERLRQAVIGLARASKKRPAYIIAAEGRKNLSNLTEDEGLQYVAKYESKLAELEGNR